MLNKKWVRNKMKDKNFWKIEVEQGALNNLLDASEMTLGEKYYHERSIKLMKEAQEFGEEKSQEELRQLQKAYDLLILENNRLRGKGK